MSKRERKSSQNSNADTEDRVSPTCDLEFGKEFHNNEENIDEENGRRTVLDDDFLDQNGDDCKNEENGGVEEEDYDEYIFSFRSKLFEKSSIIIEKSNIWLDNLNEIILECIEGGTIRLNLDYIRKK